jgi:hypothetical protein
VVTARINVNIAVKMKLISLNPTVPLEAMAAPLSHDWVARLDAWRRCYSEFLKETQRCQENPGTLSLNSRWG